MTGNETTNQDHLVLILAPSGRDATLAAKTLNSAGFSTCICNSVANLCQKIPSAGAALLAEEALKIQDINCIRDIIRDQPPWSDFPLLIFTGTNAEVAERLKADFLLEQLGNITLLERPVRMQTLVSAMKSALRARSRQYEIRDLLKQVNNFNAALERRVNERTAELREVNDQVQAFAYSVSHDLRAPLRAIKNFADILAEEQASALNAEGRDYLNRILRSAKYMDELTLDLLAYSRLTRSEYPLQRISMDESVITILYQLHDEIQEKRAQVQVDRPLPEVLGHQAPIEQILCNLISNALKFTRENVPAKIRIRAEDRKGKVRFWIEDNGIGISHDHYERIFRLFERLHPVNSFPGTGMGLAIAKKAAERMGGTMGLESTVGEGTRFWFEVPKAPAGKNQASQDDETIFFGKEDATKSTSHLSQVSSYHLACA